jgi:NAD(P)H dehydrogenase (quinone)
MFAVVVVAHPSTESFCEALAARAAAGLRAAGHEVALIDLYAEGFRIAMTAEERHAYHSDQPILDPMVARHADLITRADALVFVYPTWWSGLPAILKGWLERVMVPGVGFRFDERTGKVRPGLPQVRHIVGISTYGSPRPYVRLINDNGRRTISRALRMSCGFRARPRWFGLYGIDTSTPEDRHEFAARVEREMAALR